MRYGNQPADQEQKPIVSIFEKVPKRLLALIGATAVAMSAAAFIQSNARGESVRGKPVPVRPLKGINPNNIFDHTHQTSPEMRWAIKEAAFEWSKYAQMRGYPVKRIDIEELSAQKIHGRYEGEAEIDVMAPNGKTAELNKDDVEPIGEASNTATNAELAAETATLLSYKG